MTSLIKRHKIQRPTQESRAARQAYTTRRPRSHYGTSTAPPAPQTNGASPTTADPPVPVTTSTIISNVPPEVEYTLSRLSGHRNVRGVLVLARQGMQRKNDATVSNLICIQGQLFAIMVWRLKESRGESTP
ncbi:hypothetical protein RSOL_448370 [Rhizoctonia solani AG-3 Rhs1AP]|uniref:Uncharacterized protein n=1 Tax=Rhizoctonia solani AG-3 Rhs1AP TaxID=1086054 RepID=X8JNQ4_9AGAM|nr:hypothetical protein RSOL_448370 [Rhizoctonia solani AG-3 Rhs1AP]